MNATRAAYLLLCLDVGAIWACLCVALAVRADAAAQPAQINEEPRTAPAPPQPRPVPGWAAPTVLVPFYGPPADPWEGKDETPVLPRAALDLSTRAVPVWAGPTMRLPVGEVRRRVTRPAPEPYVGRYIEMILTPRREPSPLPC